jgi:F-type H+-transporting ATPase subunit delta
MRYSALALRYANALFSIAKDEKSEASLLSQITLIASALVSNDDIKKFIDSPMVLPSEKEAVVTKALQGQTISPILADFLKLLSKKGRLPLIDQVAQAFQFKVDEASGVTRGDVRSGAELTPDQKIEVENKISKVFDRKVILNYTVDKKLKGGLSAKVGSYLFDDSVSSHLNRIQDELNRRLH